MLNRFRRGSSTGNPKTNIPNKGVKKSPPAVQRYNSSSSNNSNNNNTDKDEDAAAVAALQELREKLDRLDLLTNKIEKDVTAATVIAAAEEEKLATADNDQVVNNDKPSNQKVNNDNEETKKGPLQPAATTTTKQQHSSPPPSKTTAKFAPISKNDENEIIEILRRIAELVVLSERRAGQILSEAAAADVNKLRNSHGSSNSDEESNTATTFLDEDAALPYLAPFELFCERNVLANIVNIVTGVAFAAAATSSSSVGSDGSQYINQVGRQQLPPLTIATQAIQSVSILIQNVSRATSLYLLLSNNRVNDLIRLPLDLYKLAEWERLYHSSSSSSRGKRQNNSNQQQQQQQQRVNLITFTSPEIGELTTHFVSFLKSLAMRVNAETLQFFLSFPMSIVNGTAASSSSSGEISGGGNNGEGGDNDDNDQSVAAATLKSSSPSDTSSPEGASDVKPPPPSSSIYTEQHQPSYMEQRQNVDFPLYSRALEFCSIEQDSFVRVTAMNVCMNIIRLATVEHSSGDGENGIDNDSTHSNQVPTGALHEATTLPLQDRIAIAQYACHPRRVSDLISPLCSRLTSQFGQVEGAVRALEESNNKTIIDNNNALSTTNKATTPDRNAAKKKDETRDRLVNHIRDLIANVQDELLLLDDLLEVGLISLNEQAIEMLLATFVYPMLLQPLLLPLHRFSSSKNGSISTAETPMKARKPTITLQTPPPFSRKPTDSITSNFEKEASISNDSELDCASNNNTTNVKDLHSSDEMDLAPSKTAMFGLSVIFHAVSNPSFRHLLLTALLHPLSPQASGGLVIICPPQITLPVEVKEGGDSVSASDLPLEIRMEENQIRLSKRNEEFQRIVPVYSFGTQPKSTSEVREEKEGNNDDSTNTCIFILAPALVDMLRNHTGLVVSDKRTDSTSEESTPTRPNPYRSVLISAINGLEEMVSLQSLAVTALQSALLSVEKSIFKRILFASKQLHENSDAETYVTETVRSLCRSVVNRSVTYDGWWKVKFNTVAARTLMDTVSDDYDSLRFVSDIMSDIRVEAAEYLLTLPSQIDAKSRQCDSPNNSSKQHLDSWLLDRFYFDQPDKSTNSAVESICYLKEETKGGDVKEQYRYGLEVLSINSITKSTDMLCESSRVIENMLVSESSGNTPFHCAASWALACLYLDAFCIKIAKLKATFEDQPDYCISPQRQLSYISATPSDDTLDSDLCMSLAHLSSKFAIAMLDEAESSESNTGDAPAHGSVVGLIGKAAFPCVCEVSSSFSNLFTGRTCVLNEGIQWQSLYLVVVGKWAVLAEPERGGTGGEGRVITSCRLSCLALRKDTSLASNNTPARRLLVAHSSLDPRLPALFLLDSSSSRRGNSGQGPSLGPDGLRLTRSRMDLWFEDSNAAGHAYKVLSSKIAKARAKRGGNIKAALLAR